MKNLLTLLCAGLICGAFAFSVGCAGDQEVSDKEKTAQKEKDQQAEAAKKKAEEEKKAEEAKKKSRNTNY